MQAQIKLVSLKKSFPGFKKPNQLESDIIVSNDFIRGHVKALNKKVIVSITKGK